MKRLIGIVAAVGIFACLLLYIAFGFYYEDHSGLAALFQGGEVLNNPTDDFYIYCQTFSASFFSFLTIHIGSLPWVDYFYIFFLFSAYCISAVISFVTLVPTQSNKLHIALFSGIFFLIFFADSFVFFSWIRLSYVGTFLMLLGCLKVSEIDKMSLVRCSLYLFFLLLFGFCLVIRYETGIAACFAMGVYVLCTGKKIVHIFKAFSIPILMVVYLMVYLNFKANEVPFLKQTEPSLYYLSDAINNPDFVVGKNPVDSVKYLAVIKYFINDKDVITSTFIKKMALEKASLFSINPPTIFHNIKVACCITIPFIIKYLEFVLLYLLLFILLIRKTRGIAKVGIIGFNLFILAVIAVTAYGIKMEDRIFIPLIVTGGICNVLFVSKIKIQETTISKSFYLIIVLLLFSYATRFTSRAIEFRLNKEQNRETLKAINEKAKNKYLYIDVNSHWLLHSSLFKPAILPSIKQFLFYDQGQLSMVPFFKKIADYDCQCNSAEADMYYRFLISKKNSVIIISNLDRMNFISGYMELIHKQMISFKRGEKLPGKSDLFYFTIK